MKELFPSFAPPSKWRNKTQTKKLEGEAWRALRFKVLKRDNFTCVYCGYSADKYQIADHIDGNPENNNLKNLQTVCQMCNLIKHAGQGCVVQGVVDLYEKSKFSQIEVIKHTRELRDKGLSDNEIIRFLGLRKKVPFRMDRKYLRKLLGFISSKRSKEVDDMYNGWINYHKNRLSNNTQENK